MFVLHLFLINIEQMFGEVCTFKIDYAIMGKNH